jgi:hypothetical protein
MTLSSLPDFLLTAVLSSNTQLLRTSLKVGKVVCLIFPKTKTDSEIKFKICVSKIRDEELKN